MISYDDIFAMHGEELEKIAKEMAGETMWGSYGPDFYHKYTMVKAGKLPELTAEIIRHIYEYAIVRQIDISRAFQKTMYSYWSTGKL